MSLKKAFNARHKLRKKANKLARESAALNSPADNHIWDQIIRLIEKLAQLHSGAKK